MANEDRIREAFKKAKDDVEGVKNELAFALKRIAKLEEALTRQAIKDAISKDYKKKK